MSTTPMTTTVVAGNPQVNITPTAKTPVVTKTSAKKRKLHHFTTAITELRNIQNDLNKMDSTEISDNDAFGQYVIAALNKLSPRQAILAQSDIQSLLTKYRLAEQSGSNSFHSTSPQSFYTTDEDTSTQYNIATDQDTSTQYNIATDQDTSTQYSWLYYLPTQATNMMKITGTISSQKPGH
ncbi:unnamed protein product [Macrosiphum euphorbiae]|uniref:BESS domain-containing protein n=1 Tax=Macrosiphum euphorbiae TaxID=13131 RepID=A0AAV0XW95_9HEMI|nr:unnamed protein product [Macrosiphum euphorbiae]